MDLHRRVDLSVFEFVTNLPAVLRCSHLKQFNLSSAIDWRNDTAAVLPKGFKRIRHYGLLTSCHKRKKLAACRLALHAPEPDPAVIETVDAFMQRVAHVNITRCPHCTSGVMQVIEEIAPKRILMPLTTGPPS